MTGKKSKVTATAGNGDVLVSRFSALGDVAMTIAPLYDACLSNPSRRFILLTRKHPATLFLNPPENLVIFPVDTSQYRGFGGIRRLWRELNSKFNITAYADLHDVLRTQLLRFLFRTQGIKVSHVDKGRNKRRKLTRRVRKHLVPLKPMAERYAETLKSVGVPGSGLFQSLFPSLPDENAFSKASSPKKKNDKWLGIAPFAAHAGKVYPPELMGHTIGLLLKGNANLKIFVFGFGEEERSIIDDWKKKHDPGGDRIVNMAEKKIGLPAELSLMAHCNLMLSMDSANMHLAGLAGCRCLSIWGATHPYCGFRPAGMSDGDMIQLDMTCRPCSVFGNKKCHRGNYPCLRGISPERIASIILKRLE